MCLILTAINPNPEYKLVLASNRDEFYERPTKNMFWRSNKDILSGEDELKKGMWLGLNKNGRLAAVTNVRDFSDDEAQTKILSIFKNKIDVIISDMAENTTGNKSIDSIRTNTLCSEVINFSTKVLTSKGSVVSKLFMGEDFLEVKDLAKKNFKNVEFFKPKSSRSESKETYIFCSTLKTL